MEIEKFAATIKRTCRQEKLVMFDGCAVMNNIVVGYPSAEAFERLPSLSGIVPKYNGDVMTLTIPMVDAFERALKTAIANNDDRIAICYRSKIYTNYDRVVVAPFVHGSNAIESYETETCDSHMEFKDTEYITVVVNAVILSGLCHNRRIDMIQVSRNGKSVILHFRGKYSQVPVFLAACFAGHDENLGAVRAASRVVESLDGGSETPYSLTWWTRTNKEAV